MPSEKFFLDALASLDFKLSVSQGCFSASASSGLLELFFCKVSFTKHPSVSGCVLYSSKICDEFFMINDDCQ